MYTSRSVLIVTPYAMKCEFIDNRRGYVVCEFTPDECRALRLSYGMPFRIGVKLSRKALLREQNRLGPPPLPQVTTTLYRRGRVRSGRPAGPEQRRSAAEQGRRGTRWAQTRCGNATGAVGATRGCSRFACEADHLCDFLGRSQARST